MKKLLSIIACMVMGIAMMMAQNKTVTGRVVSGEDGEAIIGATVMVPGTTTGTVTDIDGNFSLNVPQNASQLSFSFVGMDTKVVAIPKNGKMLVTLESLDQVLDDVVVTAQGLSRKDKSIGYAAQKINAEDLTMARQTDLGNSLAGKIAGARFTGASGATFDAGTIVLRGTTSFTSPAGSEPIYVVDGAITNKNAVNMDDVASINVLKGAAATALYGSQGANGAIIITTKKADDGKAYFEVSNTTQWMTYYNHFDMQKLYGGGSLGEYGEVYATDSSVDNMSPAVVFEKYGDGKNPDGSYIYDMYSDESWGPRFDNKTMVASALYFDPTSSKYMKADPWSHALDLADLFQTGVNNTTNVAFAKGGAGYNTRISFTNATMGNILQNSSAVRRFLSIRSSFDVTKWLSVTADYKLTWRKNHNAASEGYGGARNVFHEFSQWGQTNVNLKDYKDWQRPDGTWRTWNPTDANHYMTPNFHDNPYAKLENANVDHQYLWNVFTGDAEIKLPYNIKTGIRVLGNLRNYRTEQKFADGSIDWQADYYQSQNSVSDMTLQGRVTWGDRFLENKLTVDAAAFLEERYYHYTELTAETANGIIVDNYFNLAGSVGNVSASNSITRYKTRGLYGNVTIGYDDTYFLDGSLRNDWDSRLSVNKNSYLYGGLSASVMLNKFVNKPWLNYWKIRASLAQVGSTLGAYAIYDTYSTSKYVTSSAKTALYTSTSQKNQNIEPTISTSYEVGTEFRMFHGRLYGDINYYTKDTKNQILNMTVAPQSGYSSRQINAGLIRNRGIEVSLGGQIVKTKDWQWSVDVNFAHNENELVRLNENMTRYNLSGNKFYYYWRSRAEEGKPIGVISTEYRWARNDEGKLIVKPTTSKAWGGGYQPTYDKSEKDLGNYQPDLTGGFSTTLRWKGLSLGMSFDFMIGGQLVSWTNMWGSGSGLLKESAGKNNNGVNVREAIVNGGGVFVDGVTADGEPVQCYMNAYQYYHYQAYYDLDYWVYDRTYLKMRELSLGYNLPKKYIGMLNKYNLGLSSLSLSFVASNPWLIYSSIPNIDPSEATSTYLEGGQAPSTRTFGFTVKLGF